MTNNEKFSFRAIMNNYEQTDTINSSKAFTKIKTLTNLIHAADFPTALWPHPYKNMSFSSQKNDYVVGKI